LKIHLWKDGNAYRPWASEEDAKSEPPKRLLEKKIEENNEKVKY
jgi:hypothetical protein